MATFDTPFETAEAYILSRLPEIRDRIAGLRAAGNNVTASIMRDEILSQLEAWIDPAGAPDAPPPVQEAEKPTEPGMYRKEIVYDRETRDYAMYLDGELVGFGRTYHEAEITLDQLVFELMSGQFFKGAA
jgi:hypothetical protein